jgi:hypothetical protein
MRCFGLFSVVPPKPTAAEMIEKLREKIRVDQLQMGGLLHDEREARNEAAKCIDNKANARVYMGIAMQHRAAHDNMLAMFANRVAMLQKLEQAQSLVETGHYMLQTSVTLEELLRYIPEVQVQDVESLVREKQEREALEVLDSMPSVPLKDVQPIKTRTEQVASLLA